MGELLIVFHTYRFPIKGMRLRRIYNTVAQNRGDEISVEGQQLAAYEASSKIVLRIEDTGGRMLWNPTLAHTMSFVDNAPGVKSLTVLFDMAEADQISCRPPQDDVIVKDAEHAAEVSRPDAEEKTVSGDDAVEHSDKGYDAAAQVVDRNQTTWEMHPHEAQLKDPTAVEGDQASP